MGSMLETLGNIDSLKALASLIEVMQSMPVYKKGDNRQEHMEAYVLWLIKIGFKPGAELDKTMEHHNYEVDAIEVQPIIETKEA